LYVYSYITLKRLKTTACNKHRLSLSQRKGYFPHYATLGLRL